MDRIAIRGIELCWIYGPGGQPSLSILNFIHFHFLQSNCPTMAGAFAWAFTMLTNSQANGEAEVCFACASLQVLLIELY